MQINVLKNHLIIKQLFLEASSIILISVDNFHDFIDCNQSEAAWFQLRWCNELFYLLKKIRPANYVENPKSVIWTYGKNEKARRWIKPIGL